MKIAHILPGFPVEYPGGITNYVRTLIESQLLAGHEIVLASASTESLFKAGDAEIITIIAERPGDFSHKIPEINESSDHLYEKLLSFGVDVIHFHAVFGISEISLNKFSRGIIPYIISLHDYYIACPRVFMMDKWGGVCRNIDESKCSKCAGVLDNNLFLRKVARKIGFTLPSIASGMIYKRRAVFENFLNEAKLMLAVSSRVAEIYKGVYSNAKYKVLHIGNSSADEPVPIKTKSDKIRVTYLGTFSKHKGGDIFLEMVDFCEKRGANIEFKFYGKLESPYDSLVKKYNIIIGGKYLPNDVSKIMQNTDIGVALPIWEDNGPQVVMEMINYGTPVFATAVGGIPDFIPDGGGYMFNPDDAVERFKAYEWIISMTKGDIDKATSFLKKMKSPSCHEIEIVNIYKEVTC